MGGKGEGEKGARGLNCQPGWCQGKIHWQRGKRTEITMLAKLLMRCMPPSRTWLTAQLRASSSPMIAMLTFSICSLTSQLADFLPCAAAPPGVALVLLLLLLSAAGLSAAAIAAAGGAAAASAAVSAASAAAVRSTQRVRRRVTVLIARAHIGLDTP